MLRRSKKVNINRVTKDKDNGSVAYRTTKTICEAAVSYDCFNYIVNLNNHGVRSGYVLVPTELDDDEIIENMKLIGIGITHLGFANSAVPGNPQQRISKDIDGTTSLVEFKSQQSPTHKWIGFRCDTLFDIYDANKVDEYFGEVIPVRFNPKQATLKTLEYCRKRCRDIIDVIKSMMIKKSVTDNRDVQLDSAISSLGVSDNISQTQFDTINGSLNDCEQNDIMKKARIAYAEKSGNYFDEEELDELDGLLVLNESLETSKHTYAKRLSQSVAKEILDTISTKPIAVDKNDLFSIWLDKIRKPDNTRMSTFCNKWKDVLESAYNLREYYHIKQLITEEFVDKTYHACTDIGDLCDKYSGQDKYSTEYSDTEDGDVCDYCDNNENNIESEEKLSKVYTYGITEDGYYIEINGIRVIDQHSPYAKTFIRDGSYEDNAKAHIVEMKEYDELDMSTDDESDEETSVDDIEADSWDADSSDKKALSVVKLFDGRSYTVDQFEDLERFSTEELNLFIKILIDYRNSIMPKLILLIKTYDTNKNESTMDVYLFITDILNKVGIEDLYADSCTPENFKSPRKFVIGTCIDTVNILNTCIFNVQSFIIGGRNI